ncbi:MAG: ABC transporter permease [Mycoplasmataceae bacterium]|nr:ABC transporter permease [Mycoplasmataceae bacterium]
MWSVIKLQAKAYRNSVGPVFTFVFSLIFLLLFGSTQPLYSLVPSMVGMSIANISMFSFGNNFIELKNSSVVKRMGSTPITKTEFITGMIIWNVFLILVSITWMMFVAWVFAFIPGFLYTSEVVQTLPNTTGSIPVVGEEISLSFSGMDITGVVQSVDPTTGAITLLTSPEFTYGNIQWGWFIYGIIESLFMGMAIAFMLTTFAKTVQGFSLVSSLYVFILVSMLGGVFIPSSAINGSWLQYAQYISPVAYGNTLLRDAFAGGIGDGWFGAAPLQTMSVFMPWIFGAAAFGVSVKNFSWEG